MSVVILYTVNVNQNLKCLVGSFKEIFYSGFTREVEAFSNTTTVLDMVRVPVIEV